MQEVGRGSHGSRRLRKVAGEIGETDGYSRLDRVQIRRVF